MTQQFFSPYDCLKENDDHTTYAQQIIMDKN